uniref:C2H2-type domain-containing protein n=1 Tax=Kryptolebias marmoratus TaxID=37003 RepID=A0A3Q3BBY8_KRYMA
FNSPKNSYVALSVEQRAGADQQDPEHLIIKEEQEELWTSSEGEQLSRKEEFGFQYPAVPLKSDDDDDQDLPTSSSDDQMTAAAGGGAGTTWTPALNTHEDDFNSSETEVSEDYQGDRDGDNSDSQLKHSSDSGPKTENGAPGSGGNAVHKPFSCSVCSEQFLHKQSLQMHVRSHSATKTSSCFINEKHRRVKKNVDSCRDVRTSPTPFPYDDCDERFTVKPNLSRHENICMDQKSFGCDACEQRFRTKANLRRHMRTHTGQKPFSCDICGQRFRDDTNLNRHMRIHTGEKPFSCDVCARAFKDKSTLGRHVRIHTGYKPFGCDVCGRRFSQKSHLNRHMRVHTRQNVFGCDVCGQICGSKGSLKAHMRSHIGNKAGTCKDSLNTHENQDWRENGLVENIKTNS